MEIKIAPQVRKSREDSILQQFLFNFFTVYFENKWITNLNEIVTEYLE